MTTEEAIEILRRMYNGAYPGEKVAQIHLFGIMYADDLNGLSLQEIARESTGTVTYHSEISKGRKLAQYVTLKPGIRA